MVCKLHSVTIYYMEICTKCKISKPESEYFVKNRKKGRLHTQYKTCYRNHRKTYYKQHYIKYKEEYLTRAKKRREMLKREFRDNMLAYLSDKSCVECFEADIRVLEFNHLDPSQKTFTISQAVKLGYRWSDVLNEISKCEILCANCHKKHTANQFGWYKVN
jgi:hypothetical protein